MTYSPRLGVVERFIVVEDGGGRLFVVLVNLILYPFSFQAAEESLHTSVVPAVSFSTHATGDSE